MLRLLPAAALVASGFALAACQTTKQTTFNQYDHLCTEVGAPPGSADYATCIAAIEDAIRNAEREADREYGHIPVNIIWECDIDRHGANYRVLCVGELYL